MEDKEILNKGLIYGANELINQYIDTYPEEFNLEKLDIDRISINLGVRQEKLLEDEKDFKKYMALLSLMIKYTLHTCQEPNKFMALMQTYEKGLKDTLTFFIKEG